MKVVIFTGGTGSISLQEGLYNAMGGRVEGFDTKVIVNAYDNGLSTGVVRRVMGGQILGPSDVRKNQATRLRLQSPSSPWLPFLEDRFTVDKSSAREFCTTTVMRMLDSLEQETREVDPRRILLDGVGKFFDSDIADKVQYEDFSLANIVYAGLARQNGNSIRVAAALMARAMRIPDNVLLNDDKSLFLGAITKSGRRISDEGEIVSWCNDTDPFVDVFFLDAKGCEQTPCLCLEAWTAIVEADLIVLSCGTQWSSLIPTYASEGFKPAVGQSKATVLMIMNRVPDRDAFGQTSSDIIRALVPRYFDPKRIHVIADEAGDPQMRELDRSALEAVSSFTRTRLSKLSDPRDKYDPQLLTDAVGKVFFRDYLESDMYLFDYDDTLVGRSGSHPTASRFNVDMLARLNSLTRVGVCTGNSIKAVHLAAERPDAAGEFRGDPKALQVFADGGINEYTYDTRPSVSDEQSRPTFVQCIGPSALLPKTGPGAASQLVQRVRRRELPWATIENRGEAIIAIRPVPAEARYAVVGMMKHIIQDLYLEVREAGTSTVEICRPILSKVFAINHLRSSIAASSRITYVGDECHAGNDQQIYRLSSEERNLKCLRVDGPSKTAFFLFTLMRQLEKNAKL